jgi:LmbE family N-acetylglucosaminyl deacetylase
MNTDKHRYEGKLQIPDSRFQIKKSSVSICVYLWMISLLCAFAPLRETSAQIRPVYDYGATGLAQALKRLNTTASVMHIGAHPDDEDSALLAYLARGENARTAYLSLTRGDGGQNIIGSELFESLGVIRTEELLQARRLDGSEQFFTRAFDYGFSKTLAEAKEKWDEKVILCDAVRAIRTFRPLVVISRFSGTPADGHGQHQYSGYIAPLAVKAAADAKQCTDAGAPWQVLKFYVSQGFRSTAEPTLKINTGKYDSLLGRSFFEIAMEGRSQHKTQEQGVLELKGEQFSGLNLIESAVPKVKKETSVFDGIDTSIGSIKKLFKVPDFSDKYVIQARNNTFAALNRYEGNPNTLFLQFLAQALTEIRFAKEEARNLTESVKYKSNIREREPYLNVLKLLEIKEQQYSEAIKLTAGIQIDALADKETVVPGEFFAATVKVFFPNAENVKVKEITLNAPNGWTAEKTAAPKDANQNPFRRENANQTEYFNVKVSDTAKLTEPYWLENSRDESLYRWSAGANQNLPFQPPIVTADVKIDVGGTEVTINQPVEYRYADAIRGEIRRDLNVVPDISISLDQNLLIVPANNHEQTRRITMRITNLSDKPFAGEASLNAGLIGGWKSLPASQNFVLKHKGETTAIEFEVTISTTTKPPGTYTILPTVVYPDEVFSKVFSDEMNTAAYPHIQTHRFYTQVKAKVDILDLEVAPVKVGYIMGSGDDVPEAIRRMNLSVDLLNEKDLTSGDLSKYDVIVAGIRAFQVRQDLISNNQRVLEYVKNGGTFVVQYQRPEYVSLLPFPASMTDTQKTTAGTTARVVDENAKVTILEPQSPVFNSPNKITDADFAGWVQERNLYNFTTFDAKYTALLESHDAGELENKGGMVYAEIGKGKYIYTSYSFFRQLPAGVPGAYRLFANLLSLAKEKK